MQTIDPRAIGERIAFARKQANGMTQVDLADALGLSLRSVQDYEAGKTIPWKTMRQIAGVTGVEMEWLIRGDRDEPRAAEPMQDTLERLVGEIAELRAMIEEAGGHAATSSSDDA